MNYHEPVNTPATGPGRGGPASGYKWEQFKPGNTVRLTHGAQHKGTIAPLAEALTEALLREAPWCGAAAFSTAVRSWAWSEGQAAVLRVYCDEHGVLDEAGNPRGAATLLGKVEGRLIRLRQELGLTPQSLATLLARAGSIAAATGDERVLEALAAEGRKILEARAGEGAT